MDKNGDCAKERSDALVPVEDVGKVFILENPARKKVLVVKVDGCAVSEGIRCDYLLRLASSREIFVELKGADVKKAVLQIAASVPVLSKVDREKRAGVIVASRVPKEDTSTQIARRKIAGLLRRLIIKSGTRLRLNEAAVFE